jgi:hypothetical protein
VEKNQASSMGKGGASSTGKKSGGRGKGSSEKFHKAKPRGGSALRAAGGDEWLARDLRLMSKWLRRAHTLQSSSYSLQMDGSRTQTGWHGKQPPRKSREEIRSAYFNGTIKETLETFCPVSYTK